MKRQFSAHLDRGRIASAVASRYSHPEFAYRVQVRTVLIHEPDRVVWFRFTAEEAEQFASELLEAAAAVRSEESVEC